MIGQTISHYRIVEKLGGGGMGVVYKAEDVKLGRFVALKFLPEDVARDPQALAPLSARSQGCLRVESSEHLHGLTRLTSARVRHFIVMEFLDGMTLKHRIAGRPMETELILSLAIEIADALDAAHAEGIIHRDIKPANIFRDQTRPRQGSGFRAGKAAPVASRKTSAMSAPTVGSEEHSDQSRATAVGTIAYMSPGTSPRQGTGCPHRPVLLWSCAVRNGDRGVAIPWRKLGSHLQSHSGRGSRSCRAAQSRRARLNWNDIINKCLEKDRNLRYQHAADIRTDLQRLKRDTESEPPRGTPPGRRGDG